MTRLCFALALAAALGCSKATEPPKVDESKGKTEPEPAPKVVVPENAGSMPVRPPVPGPAAVPPGDASLKAATEFITDLRTASESGDPLPAALLSRVSPAFLKIIGRPLLSDADKAAGHSTSAAQAWLKNIGRKLEGIGLPAGYGTPNEALLMGALGNGTGSYRVRLVFQGGWKIDWLSIGTFPVSSTTYAQPDSSYQDFAVLAFLDAVTSTAMPKDDRVRLLGGVMSTKLKNAWAEPFAGDTARGEDYNPAKLGLKIDELSRNVTGVSRSQTGPDAFKVELPLSGERPAYTLKLVKGAAPGEWLVDEFTKQ